MASSATSDLRSALSEVDRCGSGLRSTASVAVDEKSRLLSATSCGNGASAGKGSAGKITSGKLSKSLEEGMKYVVGIKRASRDAFLRAEQVRRDMEGAKVRAEGKELLLQNLLYEKAYLAREIERCLAYETKASAAIPLVPMKDFKATAPDHLLKDLNAVSTEGDVGAIDHATQLARLSHEMLLRRARAVRKRELANEIEELRKAVASRKEFLSDLPAKMQGITAAAVPVQETFGDPLIERLGRHELCRELPDPLYMVYSHMEAYGDSFGHVQVSVAYNSNYNSAKQDDLDEVEDAPIEDQDGVPEERTGKRKRSVDHGRSNGQPDKKIKSSSGEEALVDCGLTVKAELESPDKKRVALEFLYFPSLDVLTVRAEGRRGLLANLFPNDTGKRIPHVQLAGKNAKLPSFPEHLEGRPFKWLQWLGGIYNLPLDRDVGSKSPPSTERIVEAILDRVRAQESLSKQLESLEARPHPVPVDPSAASLFPSKAKSRLMEWTELSPAEADAKLATSNSARKAAGIPTFYRNAAAREADAANRDSEWKSFGRRCFSGSFALPGGPGGNRGVKKGQRTIEVLVQVFADYPQRAPQFKLFPTKDEVIATIVREVNEYQEELFASNNLMLLSHQVRRLQMCLDVYSAAIDGMQGDDDEEGNTDIKAVNAEQGGAGSSLLERKHRGRDRRLAFVYDPHSRTFTHR